MTSREARIVHQFARLRPGAFGRRDVARAILRLPGEAFAHRVPDDLIAELRQRIALGGVPGALDELHHADPLAAPEHAQRQPESRGGFALAGAGMDDEQALLDGLAGDLGILHGLALGHLGAMALGFGLDRSVRSCARSVCIDVLSATSGKPATISTTRSARAAMRWLSTPCRSRNRRPSGIARARCRSRLRWRPEHAAPLRRCERLLQPRGLRFDIGLRQHEVRQPQRQAIDQHRRRAAADKRCGEFPRRLDRAPSRAAARAMASMRAAISSSPASAVAT